MGQEKQKKLLTPSDYHLWSNLNIDKISEKGKWISYSVSYRSGLDTLYVRSSDGKFTYSNPKGYNLKFSGEKWFACKGDNSSLQVTNLVTGKPKTYEGIDNFEFSGNGRFLLTLSTTLNGSGIVTVTDLEKNTDFQIAEVISWRFDSNKDRVAYCLRNGDAHLMELGTKIKGSTLASFSDWLCANIIWQANGKSLLFVLNKIKKDGTKDENSTGLAFYKFADKSVVQLHPNDSKGFSKAWHIETSDIGKFKISEDGKRVFYPIIPDSIQNPYINPLVEIWQGNDKLLYSERKQFLPFEQWSKTAMWEIDKGEVFEFMPNETHVKLSGDQRYALTSSMEPCEVQFRYSPERDFYLTNLETRERALWLHCHSPEMHHTLLSPGGQYVVYYKDGNWFSYKMESNRHINLTSKLGVPFYDELNDIGDAPDAYGFAGWTADDKSIIVYDQFDLYKIMTDGSKITRLTRGREKNIKYRVIRNKPTETPFNGIPNGRIISLNTDILLKAESPDESRQGYYILRDGNLKLLTYNANRSYDLLKAANDDSYLFITENYNQPPCLQLIKQQSRKTIYQSNQQHEKYLWGKVETIEYLGAHGKLIKGLLYFPSDYDSRKIYPLIVRVYQRQSNQLNWYRNPSNPIYEGFSVSNFVNNGYFVLLPDIDYVMGNPAPSAVLCVEAAVKKILERIDIDANRVGLIGHSFGGYESSYIITKSDVFAAAVSGAPFTDLLSEYLTVSDNYKKAEYWRYEYYTNRMGKPLFEDFKGYVRNSSVFGAPGISTPLLLWTGEDDAHIASSQATELYLAMRRLGKRVTMLRYPNEGHNLERIEAQMDLVSRVLEWFDYYLKGSPKKDWFGT